MHYALFKNQPEKSGIHILDVYVSEESSLKERVKIFSNCIREITESPVDWTHTTANDDVEVAVVSQKGITYDFVKQ